MALPVHGTLAKRRQGCVCGLCKRALAKHSPHIGLPPERVTRVPTGPVRAHLEGLIADGWTQAAIAAEAGYAVQTVSKILRHTRETDALIAGDLMEVGA